MGRIAKDQGGVTACQQYKRPIRQRLRFGLMTDLLTGARHTGRMQAFIDLGRQHAAKCASVPLMPRRHKSRRIRATTVVAGTMTCGQPHRLIK
jgi:hypothetical protein